MARRASYLDAQKSRIPLIFGGNVVHAHLAVVETGPDDRGDVNRV
jgi:hypothetical protein